MKYTILQPYFLATSFQQPLAAAEYTGLIVTRFLEAIRLTERAIRFYHASTSEMFGKVQVTPQQEVGQNVNHFFTG